MTPVAPRLTRERLRSGLPLPAGIQTGPLASLPERGLLIGGGNFLRGFAAWLIDHLNARLDFQAGLVITSATPRGNPSPINEQGGVFTVVERGPHRQSAACQGRMVTAVQRALNPFADWPGFLACARNADLRLVISNTTEAGIAYEPVSHPGDACPANFPARMTCLLLERYRHFQGAPEQGLIFLPCELIERNGRQLRDLVLRLAAEWRCEPGFCGWVTTHCHFLNTLVDRIVPGHPEAEMDALTAELGWQDPLLVVTEPFYQWVIEGPEHLRGELPFAEAGLSVIWTSDLASYRERKVRVLNGAHTLMALTGCLAGVGTVSDAMKRPPLRRLVEQAISEEILPTLKTDTRETAAYAEAVLSRFANPFIQHQLLSISLNSVAKWRVRILPTLKDHHRLRGGYPPTLVFSLAALLRFYRGTQAEGQWQGRRDDGSPYPLRDTAEALELLGREWAATPHDPGTLTARVLGRTALWGEDLNALPDLAPMVARHLERLQQQGLQHALATVLGC